MGLDELEKKIVCGRCGEEIKHIVYYTPSDPNRMKAGLDSIICGTCINILQMTYHDYHESMTLLSNHLGSIYLNSMKEDIKKIEDRLSELFLYIQGKKQIKNKKYEKRLSKKYRAYVKERLKNICKLCGQELDWKYLHIDHIIPISKGGGNEIENLQVLCVECNLKKRDNILSKDKQTQVVAHIEKNN